MVSCGLLTCIDSPRSLLFDIFVVRFLVALLKAWVLESAHVSVSDPQESLPVWKLQAEWSMASQSPDLTEALFQVLMCWL